MMVETKCNWTTLNYSSNGFIFRATKLKTSTRKKQQNLKNGKVRFLLNIDVRKEMEDSRLNAVKQLITFEKGRLNFSCKRTTAANVYLTESLLDNWLKNNHITEDKIYYLRSLFVVLLWILVFKLISQPQKTGKRTRISWQLALIRLKWISQSNGSMGRWDLWLTGWTPQPRYIPSLRV